MLDHRDNSEGTAGPRSNRRVLLTDHTDFLGTWLAARLSGLGAALVGASPLPPSRTGLCSRAGLAEQIARFTTRSQPAPVVVPAVGGAHESPAVQPKAPDVALPA